ncbi:hypothetical protein [Isoptericola croceus]|uniref:hypothetical protein n=1 Tax=Isoptericola croceus TaxID=3031406 RepID=UPI0023F9AFB1|nr:hypothetical protein [Isoptericola croceus]
MASPAPDADPVTFGWRPDRRATTRRLTSWLIPTVLLVATSAALWAWTLQGDWADYAARTGTPVTYWQYEVWWFTTLLAAGPLALVVTGFLAVVWQGGRRTARRNPPLELDRTGLRHRAAPGDTADLVRWNQVMSVQVVHDDGPRLAVHVRDPQRLVVPQRGRSAAAEARACLAQHGTPLLVDLSRLAASEDELVAAFRRFGVGRSGDDSTTGQTLHAARPVRHTARRAALAVAGWLLPAAGAVVLTALLVSFTTGGLEDVVTGDSAWEWVVASLCLLAVGAGWVAWALGTMPHQLLPGDPAVSLDVSGFAERTSGIDVGRVRWAEVTGLRLDDAGRRLVVAVRHPRDVAARATVPWNDVFHRTAEAAALEQHEQYGSPVVIHLDQVADAEALVEAFERHSGHTVPT